MQYNNDPKHVTKSTSEWLVRKQNEDFGVAYLKPGLKSNWDAWKPSSVAEIKLLQRKVVHNSSKVIWKLFPDIANTRL